MTTSGEQSLTLGKVEKLLSVVGDVHDDAFLRLAITGGLRRDDIVNVLAKDVNLKEGSVTFYQRKKKNHHTVYLPHSTMLSLERLINMNRRLSSPYLFPSKKPKKPISSRTAYNILQKYLNLAGLPSIPFHALRSTCIKLCQTRGWTPQQTGKHVDDKQSTIEKHYTTPSMEERREVANEKAII